MKPRSKKVIVSAVAIFGIAVLVAAPFALKPAILDQPSEMAGIGVALGVRDEQVVVKALLPDSPATKSGAIRRGDRIVAVAEPGQAPIAVAGMELAKVVALIRGTRGSEVRLTIVPDGKTHDESYVAMIVRGTVKELNVFGDGKLLAPGTPCPDLNYVRLNDLKSGRLSQHKGKVVILEFWASWCGPCIKAMEGVQTEFNEHSDWKGRVELIAVSVDKNREDAIACFQKQRWPGVNAIWAGPNPLKSYHVSGIPVVYVLDQKGRVLAADHNLDLTDVISRHFQSE